MNENPSFEELLEKYRVVVERYINFRMPSRFDADDVIGETYYAAYSGIEKLKDKALFKPWILSIARNQCNLWFRKRYGNETISLDSVSDIPTESFEKSDGDVSGILKLLPDDSAEILLLTMNGYKQNEIADRLDIPLGTVKSRLHYAKKQFRSVCTPEEISIFEKGRKRMAKKDYTCGFPADMPQLIIKESSRPFVEIKCADESFIVPKIGNKNSEGSYRYPDKKLALVSTCYVPKAAVVHGVAGVKVCRDTYNVRAGKLYKNEAIWFTQLTDEYIRELGGIANDCEADSDFPTMIYTFLEEDYDVAVNMNDRIHGRPLLIKENPPRIENDEIFIDEYHIRYTMGTFDVTVGNRNFETVKYIIVQGYAVSENYVDTDGRLVMMRWYESKSSIENTEYYTETFKNTVVKNPSIRVNGIDYFLIEDRISEYAL